MDLTETECISSKRQLYIQTSRISEAWQAKNSYHATANKQIIVSQGEIQLSFEVITELVDKLLKLKSLENQLFVTLV